MDRNRILSLALVACKIFYVVIFVLMAVYIFIFFHWHFSSESYEHVNIGNLAVKGTSTLSMEALSLTFTDIISFEVKPDTEKIFTLGNLTFLSFYLFFLQALSFLIISFFIAKEISKIIQSVQEFDSFKQGNVASFRKIGSLCFLLFLISGFLYAQTPQGSFTGLYFHFSPLCFMLASFILAEIFKEGNRLYEEQQLTV